MNKYYAGIITLLVSCFLPLVARAQGGPLVINSGQVVTISTNMTTTGVTVKAGGELRFNPAASAILSSTGNVIIYGKLTMKPSAPATVHTLRFVGINESNFVGEGMNVVTSDVGLWVMGDGTLDIAGTPKTAWLRAAGSITAGATQIVLESVPAGWQVGDEISIAPTENPSVGTPFYTGFDLRTITAINGKTVTLSSGTARAHPAVDNPWTEAVYTAEVFNLTRNVVIAGTGNGNAPLTGNGRSHIFIRSTQPQSIKHLTIGHMGPRFVDGNTTKFVTGRYGLHFHHSMDGSRGSLVEGVVIRDTGSHAFVPHASHGITFKDTVSYNTFEDAYWWDKPPCTNCGEDENINDSHDITITHAAAAIVRFDPSHTGSRLTGYRLGQGDDHTLSIHDSVAVGVHGLKDGSGFNWPEGASGVWNFGNNISHNNKIDGLFVWQNNSDTHLITDFIAYHNGEAGIDHGAYGNSYEYIDIDSFGNGDADVRSRASSRSDTRPDGYGHIWERVRMTGLFEIAEHNLPYITPTLVKDCILGGIYIDEADKLTPGQYDFVNCVKVDMSEIISSDIDIHFAWPSSLYRFQRADGTAWQMLGTGVVSTISAFYPTNTPTPEAVLIGDTFDRTDNTNLNASNSGKTLNGSAGTWQWTETEGDSQIAGNLASNAVGSTACILRAEQALASSNHYVEVSAKLGVVASSSQVSLLVRYSASAQTYYELQSNSVGTTLYSVTAGTRTSIGTSSDTLSSAAKTVRLTAIGSTISASFNGSTTISVTDTTITSGTRTGIKLQGNGLNRAQVVTFVAGDN